MSREIKPRAWDSEAKVMRNYDEIKDLCLDALNASNLEVEQFTGLKDKNGKEIYENDLLKFTYPFDKNSTIGQVEWSDKDAGFILGFSTLWKIAFKAEVIGNVHEDGQLLEEDK